VTIIVRWIVGVHAVLVRLYPQSFRAEFEHEMQAVFAQSVADTKQRGYLALLALCLRELFDLPLSLWWEYRHRFDKSRGTTMNQISDMNLTDDSDHAEPSPPTSWIETLGGTLPFVLLGLLFTLKGVDYHISPPRPWLGHSMYWYLIIHTALLIGLGIGWAANFPRWAYAYLSVTLIMSMDLTNMRPYGLELFGYTFGREHWGWRAWIPLMALSIVMLLLTRSLRPLAQLFRGIWRDWTRLSFGLYGVCTWGILLMIYDCKTWYKNTAYLPVDLFLLALVFVGGAFFYMRCRRPWRRVLALQLAFILHLLVPSDGQVEFRLPRHIMVFLVFLLALMVVPGVPSLVSQRIRSIRSG
jgi:hypothetical protein